MAIIFATVYASRCHSMLFCMRQSVGYSISQIKRNKRKNRKSVKAKKKVSRAENTILCVCVCVEQAAEHLTECYTFAAMLYTIYSILNTRQRTNSNNISYILMYIYIHVCYVVMWLRCLAQPLPHVQYIKAQRANFSGEMIFFFFSFFFGFDGDTHLCVRVI